MTNIKTADIIQFPVQNSDIVAMEGLRLTAAKHGIAIVRIPTPAGMLEVSQTGVIDNLTWNAKKLAVMNKLHELRKGAPQIA